MPEFRTSDEDGMNERQAVKKWLNEQNHLYLEWIQGAHVDNETFRALMRINPSRLHALLGIAFAALFYAEDEFDAAAARMMARQKILKIIGEKGPYDA